MLTWISATFFSSLGITARYLSLALSAFLSLGSVYSDSHIYPTQDFFNRNISVPLDHENLELGTFSLYYQLAEGFSFQKPSLFYINGSAQGHGAPGQISKMVRDYQVPDSLNLVRIQPRGRKYSYIDFRTPDGGYDWEKVYRLMSSKQMVDDIESVRRHLFAQKPDTKIFLYGRSGGGYLVEEYLAKYSQYVARAFIRNAPHPKIMKDLGNPESRSFYEGLDAYDRTLHGKLKTILGRATVPKLDLLYMLMRMTYSYPNPAEHQSRVINELYEGKLDSYETYLQLKGLGFTPAKYGGAVEREMGPGRYLRPLECDWDYLMGPEADYVDPLYTYLRHLSAPLIAIAQTKSPLGYPTMEELSKIQTEVFCLAAVRDAVSPYQIGIELEKHIPNFELFIADDNHTLVEHPDCYPLLRNAFFAHGIGSDQLKEARQSPECKEWVSP